MSRQKIHAQVIRIGNPPFCLKSYRQCRGCFGWRNMIRAARSKAAWQDRPIKCLLTGLTLKIGGIPEDTDLITGGNTDAIQLKSRGFHKPGTIEETIDLLVKYQRDACLIAGGTDILPRHQGDGNRLTAGHLIDISGLGLDYIQNTDAGIHIGAATRINDLISSPVFSSEPYGVLAEAARVHSTHTIRNRATIGGNLCNASPCADLALPLLALDAYLVILGPNGKHLIDLESFFQGPNCTILEPDQMMQEILIPFTNHLSLSGFLKLGRHQTKIDTAIVNVATRLSFKENDCIDARIVIGSAGPMVFRAKKAEALIKTGILDDDAINLAAGTAMQEASPLDDIRASAAYRKEMVAELVKESLKIIMKRSLS
ncbi:MAG: hypothetical protein A2097_07580 [Desulfobacula sp. GWF2_41_7]|nr:MAG: hypothetical protein A2097_07580 [Desulfobacula sp. GWF2_41_7]